MADTPRQHLHRALSAHLDSLGYSTVRRTTAVRPVPEIVRVSPIRHRLAYGETVLRSDLSSPKCHERLVSFSQRRTKQRSTILFFIGVAESDLEELESVLEQLEIRGGTRGGHVHIVSVPPAAEAKTGRKLKSRA